MVPLVFTKQVPDKTLWSMRLSIWPQHTFMATRPAPKPHVLERASVSPRPFWAQAHRRLLHTLVHTTVVKRVLSSCSPQDRFNQHDECCLVSGVETYVACEPMRRPCVESFVQELRARRPVREPTCVPSSQENQTLACVRVGVGRWCNLRKE